jgi:hypothetical protein
MARPAAVLLLAAALTLSLLTGCAGWNRPGIDDMAEDFFAALDARDPEALQSLFAPSVLSADPRLPESIEALLTLYPGPTETWRTDAPPSVSTRRGGSAFRSASNWYPVTAGGENYYCYIRYTSTDEEHPENAGLQKVVFVTEKVRCSESFNRTWKDLPQGLHVLTEAEGDYETCRIGGSAFIYTPTLQPPTLEDIIAFLETETAQAAFLSRFGPPNAVSPHTDAFFYYALPDEDGEKRYAEIHFTGENDTAQTLLLWSENGYHALDIPWRAEE